MVYIIDAPNESAATNRQKLPVPCRGYQHPHFGLMSESEVGERQCAGSTGATVPGQVKRGSIRSLRNWLGQPLTNAIDFQPFARRLRQDGNGGYDR
jgi:hypothetical protein